MDEAANIQAPYGVPYGTYFDVVDDTGAPVDLSTYHAQADVRPGSPDDPGPAALTVNDGNGRLTIAAPPGGSVASRITMTLSAADTVTVGVGDFWYALVLVDGTGTPVQNGLIAIGAFQVTPTGLTL
ncbi:hypothetical protein [Fimbriiglobus ruber]|uniref:Uncharacterized protein n=1 Tax=Fimbriiglobus ruber TaxID=1908690 RepID=A0A225DXS6_9BACT|nr:hypothetical protein [Fimbriiglobus ruber]OWK45753.1 hypothetical protein FRUB_02084 [Fimbriiglobus ruber]